MQDVYRGQMDVTREPGKIEDDFEVVEIDAAMFHVSGDQHGQTRHDLLIRQIQQYPFHHWRPEFSFAVRRVEEGDFSEDFHHPRIDRVVIKSWDDGEEKAAICDDNSEDTGGKKCSDYLYSRNQHQSLSVRFFWYFVLFPLPKSILTPTPATSGSASILAPCVVPYVPAIHSAQSSSSAFVQDMVSAVLRPLMSPKGSLGADIT